MSLGTEAKQIWTRHFNNPKYIICIACIFICVSACLSVWEYKGASRREDFYLITKLFIYFWVAAASLRTPTHTHTLCPINVFDIENISWQMFAFRYAYRISISVRKSALLVRLCLRHSDTTPIFYGNFSPRLDTIISVYI